MKNYLEKDYKNYYVQNADGQCLEVTRAECLAVGEEPSLENPYKQRWIYDFEADYIVRLLRNEQGEELYKLNAISVRKEERYYVRKYACVRRGSNGCVLNCDMCQKATPATKECKQDTKIVISQKYLAETILANYAK